MVIAVSSIEQIQDGLGRWDLAGLALGIDDGSIFKDLKVSGLPRSQCNLAAEPAFQFFRQTGGLGVVISHRTIKDLNIHGWSSVEVDRDRRLTSFLFGPGIP
jgi:hypothetical protein